MEVRDCVALIDKTLKALKDCSRSEQIMMISGYIAGLNAAGQLSDKDAERLMDRYKKIVYAPPQIKPLSFKRYCPEEAYIGERVINGMAYSVYDVNDDLIIADIDIPTKIYAVCSKEFLRELEEEYK